MINMTNNDEEMPIPQDPADMYTMNCDFAYDSNYDDYDEDFMDALMNLDDPMVDFSNSDSVPGIPMKLNHEELLKGPFFVLEPGDIVCGRMHDMSHHPGNVLFELIVSEFVLSYGLATTESKRQSLLAEIYAQIEMASCNAGRRPPRYVFPAITSDGLPYYQAASQDAITEEMKSSVKLHFNVIPKSNDVLFGRGQPCRDFPGNVRLRTFIDNQRRQYASARPADRRRLIQVTRESVTSVGGRFLLPFDKARPRDGCVEASDEAIKKKIAHLYRESPTLRQEGVEIAHAHLVDEVLAVPVLLHSRPEVAPVSSSICTKDAETAQAADTSEKILDGASITSSSDQSTDTTDSSHASSARLIMKLKTCIFKWRIVLLGSTMGIVAIAVGIILAFTPRNEEESTLENIRRRGKLRCGITNQIGYSSRNSTTGLWMGFEVDICRAQAAAIFGKKRFYPLSPRDSEPVDYEKLMPSDRFHALKNKKVDILLAVTSQTMERTVYESATKSGYTFSTPYLVNEVAFAGRPGDLDCLENGDSNTTDFGLCDDLKICVVGGSTHEDILLARDFDRPSIVTTNDIDDFYKSFLKGDCNILIGEKFDLAEQHLRTRGYTDSYKVGAEVLSKEYISLVTRDGDAEFSDLCNWIIQSLFSAEQEFQMEETDAFGDSYRHIFQDATAVVGDYGQLYDLYLEAIVPRSSSNHINNGTSPDMFALPFGNTSAVEPPFSTDSPTIASIKLRGKLLCGITDNPFFARLNDDGDWVGLDADFCYGIAAALFGGEFKGTVEFEQLNPDARFDALASGKVDVLARATTVTFERDVMLKFDGIGLTFSFPNFFDSIRFAGPPDLVKCAENRDSTSHQCASLRFCVTSNTTQSDLLEKNFPYVHKTYSTSTSRNVASLKGDACNVLVGGSADIFELRSRDWFEERNFVVGIKHLSRESLALVTRDNDPLWSKFVTWVVLATIYAEENNITRRTYREMPHVNLFGPSVDDEMLQDVIQAVGNYGEIWQRHATFGNFLEREGRNVLAANSNGTSPLLRSDLSWDDL